MQQYFSDLADYVMRNVRGDEVVLVTFDAEQSDFVRFSRSTVRQAGSVSQRYLWLDLIRGQRHASSYTALAGDAATDRKRADALIGELRERLPHVPEDPYLLYSTEVRSTERSGDNRLPDRDAALDAIMQAGDGRDLVGIYAQGGIFSGFANSLGQRNWFSSYSFNFDWSFYHRDDKAVKTSYAGFSWDSAQFARKVQTAAEQLSILARPAKTVQPGQYRVYLAPAALSEFVGLLGWGGFSMKAHRTKSTPLLRMIEANALLSPMVTIRENTRDGIAPNFESAGFIKPDAVVLIENGRSRETLVSPRSAREYGVQPNGASGGESPDSLDMDGGDVPHDDILKRLDTGMFINQLWYLNFSDRPACRITGMTRFASFWVENGRIEAPLAVMRFDETSYRVLGDNLLCLTRERDFMPDPHTYEARSTSSARMPGAIVDKFMFTL